MADFETLPAGSWRAMNLALEATPPADGRQEPSIATEEVRSCMTCAHILKGALEEPCARCSNGSRWKRNASAAGSALSRWFGEHRAAGST